MYGHAALKPVLRSLFPPDEFHPINATRVFMNKIIIYIIFNFLVLVHQPAPARSCPHIDAEVLSTVRQNICDLVLFSGSDELTETYALCLRGLDQSLPPEDRDMLEQLAAGGITIESNQDEYLWRSAVCYALFVQDGNLDRMIELSTDQSWPVAAAAMSVLCRVNPDERIGRNFFIRFTELCERISRDQAEEEMDIRIIVDGMRHHDAGGISARLIDFLDDHELPPDACAALLECYAAGSESFHQAVVGRLTQLKSAGID